MKYLNTILLTILIVAVAFLYYLHFSSSKDPIKNPAPILAKSNELATVYVNGDSLLTNYEYFKEVKKGFEEKTKKTQNEIIARRASLEKEFTNYQQNGASMTAEQRAKTEESLMQKEQSFRQFSENASVKLQEEEAKLNEELFDKVSAYLKDFSKNKKYKIVLNYTKGTGILFASDSLDVTKEVLDGLNKAHLDKKKPTK